MTKSALFFCATITALFYCLQSFAMVKADPAFICTEVDGYETFKNFDEFVKCGRDCDCKMYELMCLERQPSDDEEKLGNYTLHHRSMEYAASCKAPDCLCNSQDNFAEFSFWMLKKTHRLGTPSPVHVGNYQDLSMQLPGTYEYNLVKQMNLTSDDGRDFKHPFLEETTKTDLLRRVITSEFEWSDFIEGCFDDPNKVAVINESEVEEVASDETAVEGVASDETAVEGEGNDIVATDPADVTTVDETTVDDTSTANAESTT